jgi:hypothetical protein
MSDRIVRMYYPWACSAASLRYLCFFRNPYGSLMVEQLSEWSTDEREFIVKSPENLHETAPDQVRDYMYHHIKEISHVESAPRRITQPHDTEDDH